jgi:hypothetical protein
LGGGGGVELPPPQPESKKTEKVTNPAQSVEKNRMGSLYLTNLSLRCGSSRAGCYRLAVIRL